MIFYVILEILFSKLLFIANDDHKKPFPITNRLMQLEG